MKRFLFSLAILLLCTARPAWAIPCAAANVSLGNGWTLVDCNALSATGVNPNAMSLKNGQAVNAHDTLVGFADCDLSGATGTATVSVSDNAGNVWTKFPLATKTIIDAGRHVYDISWWYVLDAKAKASGYQFTVQCNMAGGGTLADLDQSIMVFRQSSGKAARGIAPTCSDGADNIGCTPSGNTSGASFGMLGPDAAPVVGVTAALPITRITAGAAQNNGSTDTFAVNPAAGDLIIVFAHRDGSTVAPTLATGFTSAGSSGANTNSAILGAKVAAGTETGPGTWLNATSVSWAIYRHVSALGTAVAAGAQSATMSYTGLTLGVTDGTSWVAGFGGHRSATNVGAVNPGTLVAQASANDVAVFDTNGGVTSFATGTASVSATSGWRTYTVELKQSTACPCFPTIMTLQVPEPGALTLLFAQMNGAPDYNYIYSGCDGDGVTNVPFFYTACFTATAAVPASAGLTWPWGDSVNGDFYVEGFMTILPAQSPTSRLSMVGVQ